MIGATLTAEVFTSNRLFHNFSKFILVKTRRWDAGIIRSLALAFKNAEMRAVLGRRGLGAQGAYKDVRNQA